MAETVAPATQVAASATRSRSRHGTVPLWAAGCALLAAPVFAAFRSGGFGIQSQLIAAAVAFALLAVVALAGPWPPLPGGLPLTALAALIGYAVWTGLSTGWARILERAAHDTDRVGMYCAAFALALAVMRVAAIRRIAPDVLLLGILVVCLYALAGRFLPDVASEQVNSTRLSQPLTYWNALGMFAGFGTLLGVVVGGDQSRPRAWRALACAAAVPCGLALFLSLSRGAGASVVAGLAMYLAFSWRRSAVVAAACALLPLVALCLVLTAFPDILSLGTHHARQVSQGALFLPIALAGTVAAGLAFARLTRSSPSPAGRARLPTARAALAIAVVPLVLGAGVAVSAHGKETTDVPIGAARIVHAETNRGHYWRVALGAFGRHPLNGVGSGSFAAEWERLRGRDQFALDAHSIYLETLAELGVVGGLALLAFAATLVAAVVRTFRSGARDPTSAAAAAVLAAFAVHVGLDWDWEMPAVTLVALILGAAILVPGGQRQDERAWAP